ncbi:T9SS type A sorting domain-containing protein [Flavobacterium sp. 3HN19-14]|uniref:T9SS type A sorting domain-containing protein n=1 Tax=Flavobacterium sp. 3HN19-14 TaxID=3448133 RepID=UPI003EDEB98F
MISSENHSLVQGSNSNLALGTFASLERDQQGTGNKYNYNYWSSPVSTTGSCRTGVYTVAGVMKDGTNPSNILNLNWSTTNDGAPGSTGVAITLSNQWIYKFQTGTEYANWTEIGQNGSLSAGLGYTLKGCASVGSAAQNYTFVGKPNNGTINIPILAGNLVLIGNPYPSAIDANEFIKDNKAGGTGTNKTIDGTVYFWQHNVSNNTHNLSGYIGGYAARNETDAVGIVSPTQVGGAGDTTTYPAPGQYIPVGQGFFVVGTNSGNVSFKNSYRIFKKENNSESNYMLRSSNANENQSSDEEEHFIKIRLGFNTNDQFHRQIVLGFMNENATDAIDPGYDAEIFDDYPEDMAFRTEGKNLLIQGVGSFSTAAVYPLFVKTATTGNVQFTLDETKYFDGYDALIYDAVTNEYHNISESPYEMALEAGTYTDRFSLRFQDSTLGVENPVAQNVKVVYASKTSILTIENNVTGTTVESAGLFNMIGQQINNWDLTNENQQRIEIPINGISAGTYIFRIKTNNGNIAKKVVIK